VAAADAEFPGTARFEIVRKLGVGGMGVVYEARDRTRDVRVALKTLRRPSPDALLRLKREFRALQDLRHPNLVSYGELIEDGGVWFITMELVPGVELLDWVRPGGDAVEHAPTISTSQDVSPMADTLHGSTGGASSGTSAPRRPRGGRCDEERLRASLVQLAHGLEALHASRKVHRDVKPSNVRVTPEGRLVLLDFGLVWEEHGPATWMDEHVVGTADYMAPEQAASRPVGPEADWYAVGAVLYEAIVGVPPFSGANLEILLDKQRREPPPPSARVPSVAKDLDALCMELLRFDPARRPTGADVLARLGAGPVPAPRGSSPAPSFVGRAAELTTLRAAFDDSRAHAAVTVLVAGESGVGKSALVRRFAEQTAADTGAIVLAGRCYERETVPYKAVDGVMDALSGWLERQPKVDRDTLAPHDAELLGQAFPVLRRLVQAREASAADPQERKTRLHTAFRALFHAVAARRPLIVVVDDLQWADADGLALLAELVRPPDAPPLLVIGTWQRSGDDLGPLTPLPGDVRTIELRGLSTEEGRRYAASLLERALGDSAPTEARMSASDTAPDRFAEAIALEAEGHPLFIDELVRHAALRGADDHAALDRAPTRARLEAALGERIARLEPAPRRLLEIVAVAGAPIDQALAARAAGLDAAAFDPACALLRVEHLARTIAPRAGEETIALVPYHDRVTGAALALLDADRRRAIHAELARTLEGARHADPETLAIHFAGAGDDAKAARHAALAADLAMTALAFDKAARLYHFALEREAGDRDGDVRRSLLTRLGDALASAGRGVEAADAYERAIPGALAALALDLERRAAEQLLRAGHIDRGLAAVRKVLSAVGLAMPATPRRALVSLVWARARLRMRGLDFEERDASQVSAEALTRVDVCFSVGAALSMADNVPAAAFQTRSLLYALEAGEPHRIARALGTEACFIAMGGQANARRTARLVERTETLATRLGDPTARAVAQMARSLSAFAQGRFAEAWTASQRAEEILLVECTNVSLELFATRQFGVWSSYYLGEIERMSRLVERHVAQAEARGDLYAATTLRVGWPNIRWLFADDEPAARRELDDAMRRWSKSGFHLEHYGALFGRVQCDLYAGDGAGGLARLEAGWPDLERSLLLRVPLVRAEIFHLRARAALSAAARSSSKKDRSALLTAATRDAKHVLATRATWAIPLGELALAGVAIVREDMTRSRDHLTAAARGFEAGDMMVYAAVARRRLAELGAGDLAAADRMLAARAVRHPARLSALLAPGW
jgi:hypothetical protein